MEATRSTNAIFGELLASLTAACRAHYGTRLVSLAVFGSVARGTPRPDSDIDILLVVRNLPNTRLDRVDDYVAVERMMAPAFAAAAARGVHTRLSPVFESPEETLAGSPLFLDMTEDARLLFDDNDFLKGALASFAARLAKRGARRIWKGDAWL
jgi:predicted nucleotidyltransferase